MSPQEACESLRRQFETRSWFHGVTVVKEQAGKLVLHTWLRVYGTGPRPKELPHRLRSRYPVEWCRVSPQFTPAVGWPTEELRDVA